MTVEQLPHERFVRKGDDLVLHHTLPLKEALCGCVVDVLTLDGRRLQWQSAAGQVIKHGLVQCIEGAGFPQTTPPPRANQPPQPRQRQGRGRLLIYFAVEFPSSLGRFSPLFLRFSIGK